MKTFPRLAALLLAASAALAATPAQADDRQDLDRIKRIAEDFVRKESAGLPGIASFTVQPLDSRLSLPACPSPQAFLPPGARLWGRTTVGVRCDGPVRWSVYTAAQIEVNAEYLVTARPIAQGETIGPGDFATLRGDLARLPAGILVDPAFAIGKQAALSMGAGQPLRRDMLRAPRVVQQGQRVKLVTTGAGFQVSAEGLALGNAQDGQLVQVRAPSGQTVSGLARAGGVVEVRH